MSAAGETLRYSSVLMFVHCSAMKRRSVLHLIKLPLLSCTKCIVVGNLLIFRKCLLSVFVQAAQLQEITEVSSRLDAFTQLSSQLVAPHLVPEKQANFFRCWATVVCKI